MFTATIAALVFSFVVTGIYFFVTLRFRTEFDRAEFLFPIPLVSIMKPVKGVDGNLRESLESFYRIEYPRYEMLFAVESEDDPCMGIIRELQDKNPHIPTKIIITGTFQRSNPKVYALGRMAREANGELYWISDANTRVGALALNSLVTEYLKKGSKIVFSPIMGAGDGSWGSMMSNSYLNLFVSGNIITAWRLFRRAIIVGKSMLVEAKTLRLLGGFGAFGEYLAEDYMMGEIYAQNNIPVSTNYTWITNDTSKCTVREFCGRTSRWAKMRFRINPFWYLLEVLTNPVAIACFSSLYLGTKALPLIAVAVILKTGIEYLHFLLMNRGAGISRHAVLLYPFSILLKDVILAGIYLVPLVNRTVRWRNWKIRIGFKSRIRSVALT